MTAPPPHHRRRHRRPAALAAVAALLLPAATACGGVGLADTSDTFTTMGYGMGDALATVRVEKARKTLGTMKLEVNEGAFDEQQFLSAVAAGDPPDAVRMDRTLIGGYAARGAIMPLTECLRDQDVDLEQYRDGAVDEATLDGTVYGLPDSYDNRLLLINGKVVEEAGHRAADIDTSDWQALRALAEDLDRTRGGKLTRIGFDPKIPEFFPLWVRANGGSLLSADGRTAKLDDPRTVEALRFTVGLIDAQGGWGGMKALRDSFDQFGAGNQLVRGQVGAYPMEDWYVSVLAETSPDVDLRTKPFTDRRGEPVNYVSGYSWVVPKGSPHPEEACEFITEMTAPDTWFAAARAKAAEIRKDGSPYIGDFTGNKVADRRIHEEIWKPTGNAAFDEAARQLYAAQDNAFSVPANAAGTEFRKAWQSAVNSVLSGDAGPREALEQAQQRAQAALDRGNTERE
ncbi:MULTISPECIES: extracellular solute-binding protein [Streptomyces]|uniref:Extracellular solute-binding protein n=2 Tax=Streptomyces TaxID=1883 RepID=A0ABQ7FFA1_9ACTN|nr:extracellular solute-binding protein [Streptomyces lycii]KAF4407716.1 extracellular solute-binding protein [Streptomyces lycii]PGH46770.1 sugar ABC transporter substrate-binding protein [Streptomyces sp. Ru87]